MSPGDRRDAEQAQAYVLAAVPAELGFELVDDLLLVVGGHDEAVFAYSSRAVRVSTRGRRARMCLGEKCGCSNDRMRAWSAASVTKLPSGLPNSADSPVRAAV
ncbi:hypothetical protein GCM10023080_017540 [Streptomyces pseudoechinosporeus]